MVFGGWKNKVTIKADELTIIHEVKDEKKQIIAQGKISLKKIDPKFKVELDTTKNLLTIESLQSSITCGEIFKIIEELTST